MKKFIISNEGELIFGDVHLHKDLLPWGDDECYGGGLWKISAGGMSIDLYGRSFDFGIADFDKLRSIDWSGIGGKPVPLFFYPNYPDMDDVIPVMVTKTR